MGAAKLIAGIGWNRTEPEKRTNLNQFSLEKTRKERGRKTTEKS